MAEHLECRGLAIFCGAVVAAGVVLMCKGMFWDGNGIRRRPPSAESVVSSESSVERNRSGVSSLFSKVAIDTEWGEMEDYEEIGGGPMLLSVSSPPLCGYAYASLPTSPGTSSAAWFDVRVVYVRVTGCSSLEEVPEFLTMRFPSRSISTALEVNGGRISPLEEASVVLRRDRVDSETVEATYVSTDNLRMSGSLHYEVFNNQEALICGDLDYVDSKHEQGVEIPSKRTNNNCGAWSMECTCLVGQSGCAFLRGRHYDFAAAAPTPPASTDMEICVVGRHLDTPVFLTQTVHLTARRRSSRLLTLDAIPETGELCEHHNNGTILIDSPRLVRLCRVRL